MPRKRSFDVDKLRSVLLKNQLLVYDNTLKRYHGPSHSCWQTISNLLYEFELKPKHIYTIVIGNRYKISEKFDFKLEKDNEKSDISDEIDCVTHEYSDDSCKSDDSSSLKFKISIPYNEWKEMICSQQYGSRNYEVLKPGWTDKFDEMFFSETRMGCCLTYKRIKLTPSGNTFLKFPARCTNCNSRLNGIAYVEPEAESPLIIDCEYIGNFEKCRTNAKRRLTGDRRAEFARKMIKEGKSAVFLKREEAYRKMNFGDPEPSNLPSLNALHIIKHREIMNNALDKDPLVAVYKLKNTMPYSHILRDIGFDPFFLHYWASTETNTYKLYARKTENPTISIDATGGVVRKCGGSHIFLYEITVHDGKNQFSAGHMLSARHNNNAIAFWLSEWAKQDMPKPKTVVTDQSRALIMACVKTFTQYSTLSKYLNVCEAILMKSDGSSDHLPTAFIRLDFNHVMHCVASWPELCQKPKRVKQFYLRAIGLVISSTKYDDVKFLLRQIFTVSLHEEEGSNKYGQPTACESAKVYLKKRIATHNELEDDIEGNDQPFSYMDEEDEEWEPYDDRDEHQDVPELRKMYDECQRGKNSNINCGDRDNMHHDPAIAVKLLKFCDLLPLWSGVMLPYFGYGNMTETSASSESRFNDLKHRVFRNTSLPVRVDSFLETHCISILGEMNLIASKSTSKPLDNLMEPKETINDNVKCITSQELKVTLKNDYKEIQPIKLLQNNTQSNLAAKELKQSDPVRDTKDIQSCDQTEVALENWRNLANLPPKKRRKPNYLEADPSIQFIQDDKSKTTVVGILRNGMSDDLAAVTVNGKKYCLRNTCPFDAIFQIVTVAYTDSPEFTKYIQKKDDIPFFKMIIRAAQKGITPFTYHQRAECLLEFLKDQIQHQKDENGIYKVDCRATALGVVRHFFKDYSSVVHTIKCTSCGHNGHRFLCTITAHFPSPESNIHNLETVIKNEIERTTRRCGNCGSTGVSREDVWGEHLWISCCYRELDLQIRLRDVPEVLLIAGNNYHLNGLVEFIPSKSESVSAIGHYVALTWRSHSKVWERYDDMSTKHSREKNTSRVQSQFLFYTKGKSIDAGKS